MALNPKQQRFVEEYLIDLNATQAALRAGYSPDTAYSQGDRLLKHVEVAAAITKAKEERSERTQITADRVLEELAVLGFSDIRHYVIDDNGNVALAPGAPDAAFRAVASIKRKVRFIPVKDAPPEKEVETEIRFWDKPESLGMIGKHLGMFKEQVELSGAGGGPLAVRYVNDWRNLETSEQTAESVQTEQSSADTAQK